MPPLALNPQASFTKHILSTPEFQLHPHSHEKNASFAHMADATLSHPEPPQPPLSPSKQRVADAMGNPTDTTLVLLTLTDFLTKLEATKTKTAKKYQISIDDWQLVTAYVAQLQKNHRCATDLTDNVTALELAITQLSSNVSRCLDSIKDRLESEPALEQLYSGSNEGTCPCGSHGPNTPAVTQIWTRP